MDGRATWRPPRGQNNSNETQPGIATVPQKKGHARAWPFQSAKSEDYTPPAPANLRDWKHSRQKTGRPCVGRNGTVVSFPHAEHCVWVSTRSRTGDGPELTRFARLALHVLQRLG